jgi:hypothetical protein
MMTLMVKYGGVYFWQESGVYFQAIGFFVVEFGRNMISVTVKTFSHFNSFRKESDKFCNFSAICKANAAVNCVTLQHKKVHSSQLWRDKREYIYIYKTEVLFPHSLLNSSILVDQCCIVYHRGAIY